MNHKSSPKGDQTPVSLPLEHRADHYRRLASETMSRAKAAQDSDKRAGLLTMASGWHAMALEVERLLAKAQSSNEDQSAADNPEPGVA
jgi:hypothetical protein